MHSSTIHSGRLAAAGAAIALHVLALALAFGLSGRPAPIEPVRPVEIVLIRPPEALPAAPPPRVRAEPPKPQPPPPKPEPPAARRAAPAPRVEPAPAAAPAPAPAVTPAPVPAVAPAPVADEPRPAAITRPAAAPAPVARAGAAPDAGKGAPVRTGPRADASWSGNAPPPYPSMARRLGEEGEVQLDVHVRQDGTVDDVKLKKSSGSPLLDQTAIDTVKKWRFKPATVDGKPVDEWYYNWKWVFRLES